MFLGRGQEGTLGKNGSKLTFLSDIALFKARMFGELYRYLSNKPIPYHWSLSIPPEKI